MRPTPTSLLQNATRPLSEHSSLGCALIDQSGHIVSVTPSFADMLNCPVAELYGQSVFDVLACEENPKCRDLLLEGTVIRVMTVGHEYPLTWTVQRTARGAALGGYYLGLLYKASESEYFARAAGPSDNLALLGGVTAELVHEIAGPLNVIANNAELLLGKLQLDEESRRFIAILHDESQRLASMLQGFLSFAGNAPLKITARDVGAIVERTLLLLSRQYENNEISFEVRAEADLPEVAGDGEQLQQVFFNLIKNASEASPKNGRVLILIRRSTMGQTEPAIEVLISDQGEGISLDEMERIWEPFYSNKSSGKGTGLGLPIAQRIIAAHNGELKITSELGRGTHASILLPVFWESSTDEVAFISAG